MEDLMVCVVLARRVYTSLCGAWPYARNNGPTLRYSPVSVWYSTTMEDPVDPNGLLW